MSASVCMPVTRAPNPTQPEVLHISVEGLVGTTGSVAAASVVGLLAVQHCRVLARLAAVQCCVSAGAVF